MRRVGRQHEHYFVRIHIEIEILRYFSLLSAVVQRHRCENRLYFQFQPATRAVTMNAILVRPFHHTKTYFNCRHFTKIRCPSGSFGISGCARRSTKSSISLDGYNSINASWNRRNSYSSGLHSNYERLSYAYLSFLMPIFRCLRRRTL